MTNTLNYINNTWTQAFNSVLWFSAQPYSNASKVALQAQILYNSFQAGVSNITALQLINAFTAQNNSLQQIEALPIGLASSASALTYLSSNLVSLVSGLSNLLPSVPVSSASSLLNLSNQSLPTVDYTTYLNSYSGDLYPLGIPANLSSWANIQSNLIAYYGNSPTNLLDLVNNIVLYSNTQNNLITSGGITGINSGYYYNQAYSLPVSLALASNFVSDFSDYSNQQALVVKHILQALSRNISETLLSALSPTPQNQITTTVVYGNESLQDIANRVLGNFELWEEIAVINNITPGTLLTPGTSLILPPTSLTSGASGFSYNVNVLGQDIYLGPTTGAMPTWTGDFTTISGPTNLLYALSRRLLTTLGTFVYHPDYGSRIPPEVGAVQSIGSLQHITAFGNSCLTSDPRVATIINSGASGSSIPGLIQYSAVIQPIGPQSGPVVINEVISP